MRAWDLTVQCSDHPTLSLVVRIKHLNTHSQVSTGSDSDVVVLVYLYLTVIQNVFHGIVSNPQ